MWNMEKNSQSPFEESYILEEEYFEEARVAKKKQGKCKALVNLIKGERWNRIVLEGKLLNLTSGVKAY